MEEDDTFEENSPAVARSTRSSARMDDSSMMRRKTSKETATASSSSAKLEHRHRAQSIIQSKALDELETEVFETGLYENADFARGSRIGVMMAEIFYSYLWWSMIHGFPALIWFFPLCAMEISGYESLAVVWFSPLLVLIGPLRRAIATPLGLLVLRLLSLVGVASYQAPTLLSRLVLLAVGNFFCGLVLTAKWWNMSKLDRHRQIYLHLLGYLFFLAIRVWGTSFNVIFVSFIVNNITTAVAIALCFFLFINDERTPIISSSSSHGSGSQTKSGNNNSQPSSSSPEAAKFPGLVVTSCGFGALMFLTMLLFGEVSVVSRWAVAPYPDIGPYPMPWGLCTMGSLTVGLILFGHQWQLLSSPAWAAVGVVFSMVLYFAKTYTAFFGGQILAIYTMSLWPMLSKRFVSHNPGKAIPLAMTVCFILVLLAVWVVAYNFVPGGIITRERSDAMLILTTLIIGFASRNVRQRDSKAMQSKKRRAESLKRAAMKEGRKDQGDKKQVTFFGRVFRRLSTITEEGDEDWAETEKGSKTHQARVREVNVAEEVEGQKFHNRVIKVGMVIFLIALLGFAWRYRSPPPMPVKEHPNMFSGGIWAFHFGYDNNAYPSMERAAQLIQNTEVDVIGLLETDATRPYIGNHDIASWLGERLKMHVDYGPGSNDHTWGCLVLSKYPILKSEHYLLPSPDGELAPAILATVNVSGNIVDFYIVHFGNEEDKLDRQLQAETSASILANTTNPVVMLSYITNPPGSRDYRRIVEHGRVKDIDPNDKKRWCEYIFYRGVIKVGYARISHGGLSDTEVQVGKFRLPDYPEEPDNEVVTQNPDEVPQWTHFPETFGMLYPGHYYDQSQHHFHMNTPKYFKPKPAT